MKKANLLALVLASAFFSACISVAAAAQSQSDVSNYRPIESSLANHTEAPKWLQDAKIGIYFHWGVYSVPAFDSEWYPRNMHWDDTMAGKHHRQKYGEPAKFGYHDFIPKFTGEHFDPADWAQLFADAGARFAGPVAEHHDGFAMWDSKITPWNAAQMGPKRDITGELATEIRARNMKLIATFHHARQLQRDIQLHESASSKDPFDDSHFPYIAGQPPASDDPQLQMLYGNLPEDKWLEEIWFGKLKEVIDRYHPDIIWFDCWLDQVPTEYRMKFAAYYLNEAKKRNQDVVIVRKHDDLPDSYSILDHEKARTSGASKKIWMTDDTISTSSWCYTENLKVKPARDLIHAMIDTVSKNGIVLLNISPKSNGEIPLDQRQSLLGLGKWLKQNGKTIYSTRPWITYGEGPTKEPDGGFSDADKFLKLEYSEKDVRYTATPDGKTVYAILLGRPAVGTQIVLKSFDKFTGSVSKVVELSSGKPIEYNRSESGSLTFIVPDNLFDADANVFRIRCSPARDGQD